MCRIALAAPRQEPEMPVLFGVKQSWHGLASVALLFLLACSDMPRDTEKSSSEAAREPTEVLRPGQVFRDCLSCPEMVVVPAGQFAMGSPDSEAGRRNDEGPMHTVRIAQPFAVGVYEVTVAEWNACASVRGCGGYFPQGQGQARHEHPVRDVSWDDARTYARWLSSETGEPYRLLSEAEWEYVARAGTTTAWYWGETESGGCRYANGYDDEMQCSDGYAEAAPVGAFEPNAFGLYDTFGNVFEWTQDCWNDSYLGAPTDGTVWQSGNCSERVLRGGSRGNAPVSLRSAFRGRAPVGHRSEYNGFRVARALN